MCLNDNPYVRSILLVNLSQQEYFVLEKVRYLYRICFRLLQLILLSENIIQQNNQRERRGEERGLIEFLKIKPSLIFSFFCSCFALESVFTLFKCSRVFFILLKCLSFLYIICAMHYYYQQLESLSLSLKCISREWVIKNNLHKIKP